MSGDLRQALRLVSSLTNPSRMQAARWGAARLDTKQALRAVLCPAKSERDATGESPRGTRSELAWADASEMQTLTLAGHSAANVATNLASA